MPIFTSRRPKRLLVSSEIAVRRRKDAQPFFQSAQAIAAR